MSKGHIVIGITGGIAAYKSLFLIRLFKKANYEVKVVATQNALEFVTPLSIETLSQNKLYSNTFEQTDEIDVHHIALTDWADAVIIAPATANIIGKYVHGIADDALSTFLLACKKPLFFAPAMNSNMYENEAVQLNLNILRERGSWIIEANDGFLACGSTGKGRMQEPEEIFEFVIQKLKRKIFSQNVNVLVTAGPTQEPIDPVRYIGNLSSGLMGFAIADSFAQCGATVTLIAGPSKLDTPKHVARIDVQTAAQMHQAVLEHLAEKDIVVMAAAVADYTPLAPATQKIKKNEGALMIELQKTTDILAEIGKIKSEQQYLVGFALETENETENAKKKLQNKNLDLIILNSLNNKGAGFNTITNEVTLFNRKGEMKELPLKNKTEIADDIIDYINSEMKLTEC